MTPGEGGSEADRAATDLVVSACATLAERWREPEIALQVLVEALARVYAVARGGQAGRAVPGAAAALTSALALVDDALATWRRHGDPAWDAVARVARSYRDELGAGLKD